MIDATIHYQGSSSERHKMPTVPHVGEYMTHAGNVWKVDAVVYNSASTTWGKQPVSIYCIQVADEQQRRTRNRWATWGMKDEHTPINGGSFRGGGIG